MKSLSNGGTPNSMLKPPSELAHDVDCTHRLVVTSPAGAAAGPHQPEHVARALRLGVESPTQR